MFSEWWMLDVECLPHGAFWRWIFKPGSGHNPDSGQRHKMSQPIYYFDNNATTRVAPEVVEAMLPFLKEHWGNPSSAYTFGHRVAQHVEQARTQVAALINADPRDILFTSCGTESNNSAIHSALATHPEKRHVVISSVEHSANIKYCDFLAKQGYAVKLL